MLPSSTVPIWTEPRASPSPVPPESRYKSLEEIMRVAKRVPTNITDDFPCGDVRCEECRLGNGDEEMLLCDRCDLGYHIYCLRPILARVPSGSWFCPRCVDNCLSVDDAGPKQIKRFPLTQKTIVDFFRIRKFSVFSRIGMEKGKCGSTPDARKRKRRPIGMHKKRRKLLAYCPTEDPARRFEQMASLATALTALQMKFTNDLTYVPSMALRSANQASLEKGGMQILSKEDRDVLYNCRVMHKRGECPPLIVVFDSREGFTVEADAHIKDMTLITEYSGDVDYLVNREHDDCDSIMTLLLTTDQSDSLVICPDKHGNIARFISGINNHTLEGRKKQNLKCVRYDVNGECRALLVACRDIYKGERLYYDYNGYEHEYPTHHFV